jgi:hypothetical protein
LRSDQLVDGGRGTPSHVGNFVCGWCRLAVPSPEEQVKVFPLDETVSDIERVLNCTDAMQRTPSPVASAVWPLGRLARPVADDRSRCSTRVRQSDISPATASEVKVRGGR